MLAEKLDVTVGYVSQVERGITKISLDLLAEISVLLSCEIAELVTGAAVQSDNYMDREFAEYLKRLNSRDKKLLLEMAKAMSEN